MLSPSGSEEAHASADRSDELKQRVESLKCLKRGDYERLEAARAKELDRRFTAIEKAMEKLYVTMLSIDKSVGDLAKEASNDK